MSALGCAEHPPISIRTCAERKAVRAFMLQLLAALPVDTPFSCSEIAMAYPDQKAVRRAINQLIRLTTIKQLRGGMLIIPASAKAQSE